MTKPGPTTNVRKALPRRAWAALLAFVMLTVAHAPALSANRVALVIGNGGYRHAPALLNPVNDASDMTASLQRLGFAVSRADDLGYEGMRRALRDFGRAARDAEIAVIFFAGHGMEVGGENWLIPTDAELKTDVDAEQEAIALKSVMLAVSGASKLGLVVLDACRNNPFAARMRQTVRSRAVDRGLARVDPFGSTLVAYASRDGTVAKDGSGRNSPFTSALLRHIETPGLEINFLFRRVRDEVLSETKREQEPFVYGSLSKEPIYLATTVASLSGGPAQAIQPRPAPAAVEASLPREPAPTEPLPSDIAVDPALIRLIETHPFFAGAPAVKISRYNIGTNMSSTVNRFKVVTNSTATTVVTWLRQGFVKSETTQNMSQKSNGSSSTVVRVTSLEAANGFVSLGYRTTSTMKSSWSKSPMNYTFSETLLRLGNFSGQIFPIAVGSRFSYQAVYQNMTSSLGADERQADEACEITKKYDAKSFNASLSGDAYLVACEVRNVYKKNKGANGTGQTKTIFFENLGISIRADSVAPPERTVQTYFDGGALENTTLKSVVLSR